MDRAGGSRGVNVYVGATMARSPPRDLRCSAVCRQPLPPGDCVLAQRVRRIAGELPRAAVVAVRVEGGGRGSAGNVYSGYRASGAGAGGGMANECPSGGHDPLLAGAAVGGLRLAAALASTPTC